MSFTRLNFEKLWTSSADFPTLEESETKVREDFQYHPDAIKKFLNEVFLNELEGRNGAAQIGAVGGGTVQGELDELAQRIEDVANAGYDVEGVPHIVAIQMNENDWSKSGDGFMLRIKDGAHGLSSNDFGYNIYRTVNGVRVSNTWDAICTNVAYDTVTADIVLTAESAYAGCIVVYG